MYVKLQKKDIERMEIVKTDCKLSLAQVVAKYKPDYAINGGLYDMKTGHVNPIPLRINWKTVATSTNGYWMLAWNTGSDIRMIHSSTMDKYKYALTCSTMLKDGANTRFIFTAAQGGTRGRTGIGVDKDNLHLLVTTDTNGAMSPYALRDKMKKNGAKDAIMLDAGGSSQMYAKGKYYQAEKRKVSYWILVWTKKKIATDPPKTTQKEPPKTASQCPFKEPTGTVKIGASGESVKWVQWHLRASTAPEMVVDGTFYTKTKAAVIEFQKKYGLVADGIVGPATRTKMKAVVE